MAGSAVMKSNKWDNDIAMLIEFGCNYGFAKFTSVQYELYYMYAAKRLHQIGMKNNDTVFDCINPGHAISSR